ncbi:Homeodomain-like protein [Dipodascopsis tothii]|uniref:Homeodomain-like protein n=1 Tax=Dipodascopsis tothii TaxID=44089 RepID=UPI0034CDEAD0
MANRRGPWSATEDHRILELINHYGPTNWVRIAQMLGTRTAKQCRERYHQNLKPSLNHSPISPEEGQLIERLVNDLGKKWAEIARQLDGRSDNAVKNWWNGGANRRKRTGDPVDGRRRSSASLPSPTSSDGPDSPYAAPYYPPRAPPHSAGSATPPLVSDSSDDTSSTAGSDDEMRQRTDSASSAASSVTAAPEPKRPPPPSPRHRAGRHDYYGGYASPSPHYATPYSRPAPHAYKCPPPAYDPVVRDPRAYEAPSHYQPYYPQPTYSDFRSTGRSPKMPSSPLKDDRMHISNLLA